MNSKQEVAVITGASKGLAAGILKAFAQHGGHVTAEMEKLGADHIVSAMASECHEGAFNLPRFHGRFTP